MSNPRLVDMVEAYLTTHGYDGLCNPEHECGCGIDDIAPCDHLGECYAAYARDGGFYLCPSPEQTMATVGSQRPVAQWTPRVFPSPTEIVRAYMIEHGYVGFAGGDTSAMGCYCSIDTFPKCCLWPTCLLLKTEPYPARRRQYAENSAENTGKQADGHA